MTQQEFFNRTGVEVSNDEFWAINEVYNNSEVDKDEFCKLWCKMNPARVQNAKNERKNQQREASNNEILRKWFDKYNGTQYFYDNYHLNIIYTKLSTSFVKAVSFAGIRIKSDTTFSDLHFMVGQHLGIYRNL